METELDGVERPAPVILETLPNLPHASSFRVGASATNNTVVRTWGERRTFEFEPKAHWISVPALGILPNGRRQRF